MSDLVQPNRLLRCPHCCQWFNRKGWAQHVKRCHQPMFELRHQLYAFDPCKFCGWVAILLTIIFIVSWLFMNVVLVQVDHITLRIYEH